MFVLDNVHYGGMSLSAFVFFRAKLDESKVIIMVITETLFIGPPHLSIRLNYKTEF